MDAPAPLVFVHSYATSAPNWHEVVFGSRARPGRLRAAVDLARRFDARIVADDGFDAPNIRLYRRLGIRNLGQARTTMDEVRGFLAHAPLAALKIFVSSPDHLPRIVRNATMLSATNTLFAASATPYTDLGPRGVLVHDRPAPSGPGMRPAGESA